jgi:hypothetical protein
VVKWSVKVQSVLNMWSGGLRGGVTARPGFRRKGHIQGACKGRGSGISITPILSILSGSCAGITDFILP